MKTSIVFSILFFTVSTFYFSQEPLKNNDLVFLSPLIKSTVDSDTSVTACQKWTLTEQDIVMLIRDMEKVTSEERFEYCYYYPCSYSAYVLYKGTKYKMKINSASTIDLVNDSECIYFILRKKNKKFLTPCDCCE
jgi:hypothetical protein